MTRRLKDPLLEKYLAGAMDAARTAQVEETLAESPEDARRVAELRAEGEAFLIHHPAGAFAAKLDVAPPPWWRRPLLWASLAGVLATALAVVVLRPRPPEPELEVKGGVVLALHRKTATGSAVVGPGEVLHAGDALRFEVRGPAAGYAAVFGRDAKGPVLYAPQRAAMAVRVEAGSGLLEDAVALDDAPGPEAFTAVWAPQAFEVEPVRAALGAGRRVDQVVPGARTVQRVVEKR